MKDQTASFFYRFCGWSLKIWMVALFVFVWFLIGATAIHFFRQTISPPPIPAQVSVD